MREVEGERYDDLVLSPVQTKGGHLLYGIVTL